MTRKEADALISYIEFLAALTEDYELMNRPPVIRIADDLTPEQRANIEDQLRKSPETWTPSNPFDVTPRPINIGMDFGTEDGAKCAAAWRDQFDKWHIEEAGPIDPEAFKKLKTKKRQGCDVKPEALLNMVAHNNNQMLDYYHKSTVIEFSKVVRDLTRLEIEFAASPRLEYVDEGAGKEHKAVILWPQLSTEYIYLPKDYPI